MALQSKIVCSDHTFIIILSAVLSGLLLFSMCNAISEDGRTLLQIKKSDWIDGRHALATWNASHDNPCQWRGISCDYFTNAVTKINLTNTFIIGSLTSTICSLRNLTTVILQWNNFGGPFPDGLLECKRLETLDLSENLFVGSLPHRIHELSELRVLNLCFNSFSGNIPASFGQLPKIEELFLHSNQLSGTLPAFLGNLTTLRKLTMAENPLTPGKIPHELGNLKRLQNLWLRNCSLVGEIPSALGNLKEMDCMDLCKNGLTWTIPSSLMSLSKIRFLYLYQNKLSGEIPSNIYELKSIVELDLSTNQLNASIPEGITKLKYLKILNLFENRLTGSIPSQLDELGYLQELKLFNNNLKGLLPQNMGTNSVISAFDVSRNDLSGVLPENLCRGGKLEALILFSNKFNGSLPSSLHSCHSLKYIQIYENQLTGEIPLGIWGSPILVQLKLSYNKFEGRIPGDIGKARNLKWLEISNNRFSGIIPPQIGRLSALTVFNASNNCLRGSIPYELEGLRSLITLNLDHNLLSGEIPKDIGSLAHLSQLNLGNNQLTGRIPASLGFLPTLNSLDLSNNLLYGKIPSELGILALTAFNASGNNLSGPIPDSLNILAFNRSFLGNPKLCGGVPLKLPSCSHNGAGFRLLPPFLVGIPASVGLILFVVVRCFLTKFSHSKSRKQSWKLTFFHIVEFDESHILKRLSEDNVIESGAAGKVYKVTLGNGKVVAVKKIWNPEKAKAIQDKQFHAEVDTLGHIRHANIVKLLCCISSEDSEYKLLVYEYVGNGNLFKRLHGFHGETLEWPIRYEIALGAARGLCYMHHYCSPPIVHRDVKSTNILLDEEFKPKIGDFGLAKVVNNIGEDQNSISVVVGTYGYIAPEYAYTMRVTEKSDIYSFGVVLLELVSGKQPTDEGGFGEQCEIVRWICNRISIDKGVAGVLDCRVEERYKAEMVEMLKVGLLCTTNLPMRRPSMREVVEMLLMCSPDEKVRESMIKTIGPHLKRTPSAFKHMTNIPTASSCSRRTSHLESIAVTDGKQ